MMKRYGLLPVLALAILVGCTDGNERGLMGPDSSRAALASEGGGGDALTAATVWTDKLDYQPGDTVTISGAGWWPGETVHIHITEDPQNHPDHDYYVEADEDGTLVHRELVMDEDHLGVHFTLTATGQVSGLIATTTFTDNINPISITMDGTNVPPTLVVIPNQQITLQVTATVRTGGGAPTSWKSTGWVLQISQTAPTGKLANCVDKDPNVAGAPSGVSATHSFNISAPADPGMYNLFLALSDVDGTGDDACGGVGGNDDRARFNNALSVQVTTTDPRATTTEVACDPDPVVVNEKTTCKATVTDVDGGSPVTPEGTVAFASSKAGSFVPANATCTLSAVSTGVAECSVDFTPSIFSGHDVTASYTPTSDHAASDNTADPFELTVNKRQTQTVLECLPGAAMANGIDEIACTATVTDDESAGDPLVPTGTVEFDVDPGIATASAGSCPLGSPDAVNFSASCAVTYTSNATTLEEIVARYLGTGVHAASTSDPSYIAFFDPTAGFVTGGGWIWSPAGAYADNPDLEGRANFGLVAQYQQRGRNTDPVLTGNTQFVFQAAGFNFHSESYDWLVVQGGSGKAQFKGWGTVNGAGGYQFMVSVEEGGIGVGKFRIKIWDAASLDVVYDNQEGAGDNADLDEDAELRGGNIVIHTAGNKNQGGGNNK